MGALPQKSEEVTISPGNTKAIPLDFLTATGPSGLPLQIDKIIVECTAVLTTDGATTLAGYGAASLIQQLRLEDAGGDRRVMSGYEILFDMIEELGPSCPTPPTLAISQSNASVKMYFILPFKRRNRSLEPNDYWFPVANLLSSSMQITAPTAAQIASTGGTITVVSLSYKLHFYLDETKDIRFPARDVIRSQDFASSTELQVAVNKKLLRSLTMYVKNGTALTAWNTAANAYRVSLPYYNIAAQDCYPMSVAYATERDVQPDSGLELVQSGYLFRPVWASDAQKIPDMRAIRGNLNIRFDSGTARAFTVVTHCIEAQNEAIVAATAARNGAAPNAVVKTGKPADGAKRNIAAFGLKGRFMPWKQAGMRAKTAADGE